MVRRVVCVMRRRGATATVVGMSGSWGVGTGGMMVARGAGSGVTGIAVRVIAGVIGAMRAARAAGGATGMPDSPGLAPENAAAAPAFDDVAALVA